MKNIGTTILAICLLMWTALPLAHAQNKKTCGTDELLNQLLSDPRNRQAFDAQEQLYQQYVGGPGQRVAGGPRKIPVVVHFIQCSDIERVADAAVYSQIAVLNEDFRRIAGSPGFGAGVDTDYEFCLATIGPDGCPTTGINRVVAPQWCYHQQTDGASMKGLIQWNPRKYFNIWVPSTIETTSGNGQVIGYATFPFNLSLSPNLDGIVIHSSFFGRDGDPLYKGRTTTHEAGHWLGLFHTFQGGCQGASANTCASQGDRVCDTPQAAAANFGCPSLNSCTDSPTDLPDQIENYMDYSDGACQNMYTQGQKDRIDFYCNSIRTQLWSAANLTETGCDGTVAVCAPRTDFIADHFVVCVGQPVQFTDISGLSPTSWNWTFSGGSPATSTAQTETVTYSAPGTYNVTLVAGNATGSNTENKIAYIEVVQPSTNLLQQGFEGLLYLPALWQVEDNGGLRTWQLITTASSQGQNSMKVNNFEARNNGESISLISNPFSMQNVLSGYMTFDHAYKKYSGLTADGMKVHISTDCGATWEQLWYKSGPYLATVAGSTTVSEWVPTQASNWKSDTISLDSFAGEPNVKVRFEVLAGGGQSVYLDNINMTTVLVGAQEPANLGWDFTVAPNPFHQDLRIEYTLQRPTVMEFVVTDVSGKVLSHTLTEKQSAGRHSLTAAAASLRDLPAGIYFLKGTSSTGSITRKLVKMN
jgi:PKD repeat protein